MRSAALRVAALAALAVVVVASPVGAQDQPAPATTVAAAPTTTIPAGCTPPMPVAVEFVGKVTAGDATVARFTVTEVRQGSLPGPMVDIDYGDNDDRRYIKDGHTYLVVAAINPESSHLVSKVRQEHSEPKGCSKFDPIFTNNADGTPIDSSVLGGLHGKLGDIAGAFLLPTAIIFGVLLGLVILKHTFLLTGRGVSYARRRRRTRRSPPGNRPADTRQAVHSGGPRPSG